MTTRRDSAKARTLARLKNGMSIRESAATSSIDEGETERIEILVSSVAERVATRMFEEFHDELRSVLDTFVIEQSKRLESALKDVREKQTSVTTSVKDLENDPQIVVKVEPPQVHVELPPIEFSPHITVIPPDQPEIHVHQPAIAATLASPTITVDVNPTPVQLNLPPLPAKREATIEHDDGTVSKITIGDTKAVQQR